MTAALGVEVPLNHSVFSAAGIFPLNFKVERYPGKVGPEPLRESRPIGFERQKRGPAGYDVHVMPLQKVTLLGTNQTPQLRVLRRAGCGG